MATDTKAEAPTYPRYDPVQNTFFDDECVAGPGYDIAVERGTLTPAQIVARRNWEADQQAKAEGQDDLSVKERLRRQQTPIETYSLGNFRSELVVDHRTGEAQLRLTGQGTRAGRHSGHGVLTVRLPANSWHWNEQAGVDL